MSSGKSLPSFVSQPTTCSDLSLKYQTTAVAVQFAPCLGLPILSICSLCSIQTKLRLAVGQSEGWCAARMHLWTRTTLELGEISEATVGSEGPVELLGGGGLRSEGALYRECWNRWDPLILWFFRRLSRPLGLRSHHRKWVLTASSTSVVCGLRCRPKHTVCTGEYVWICLNEKMPGSMSMRTLYVIKAGNVGEYQSASVEGLILV